MKKLFFFTLGLFFMSLVFGQNEAKEKLEAMELVKTNHHSLGIASNELENLELSSTYMSPTSGARMVYLTQCHLGITIHNQMLVVAFKNNKIASQSGSLVANANQISFPQNGLPVTSAEEALRSVLNSLSLSAKTTQPTTQIKGNGPGSVYYHFGNLSVSDVDITAHLVWVPLSSKKMALAWEVEIAPSGTSDHWMIRVDAVDNSIIGKNNYTVFEHIQNDQHTAGSTEASDNKIQLNGNSPDAVSSATYEVIPFPAESPLHANGTAALVTSPWNLAGGNATSLGWHFDGTTYHDSTRGNNVWAQEDRDNNNTTFGKAAVSSSAQPDLNFDYVVDYTQAPTTTDFQRFATTNLFYWNNLIHDITYLYGFNEASGNFQNSNQGRGGLGNDYVIADAQDGGGTNNANFSTPVDGSRPRMQMYLSTYTTPNRDGDIDNGVITHEYGHGLSNRLTGGPANSSCLSNAEQGGEGWSDYLALMLTTNWNTATVNDGGLARPIGTYLFGQSPSGAGIRTYPYSTNMSINANTYAMMATSTGAVHRIGEIWCSALWDMTWEIIALDGINTNIFNPNGTGGNSVALKLVIEGMRLQPCSPGFIDARNAILKADTLLYGGRYGCAIWKAFARRGMGKFASQGSSASTTDQTADFTDNGGITFITTQSVTQQNEGQQVTYTHLVGSGTCSGISNYIIRDTLPSNVTYVSGGSYDPTTRVVSFPVNLGVAQNQNYSFTVSINPGSYFTPVQLIDESVPSASISGFWTTSSTTTTNWTTSTAQSTSAPNSLFTANLAAVSDQRIETTNPIQLPANPPLFSFQGYINSEATWDGGVVEISNNNGTTWSDLGSSMISGSYTGNLSASGNPLTGRAAFHGNSGGFVKTIINLNAYAGQSVKLRFRFGSDASVASTGWYIDDVQMKSEARVSISGLLFNQNGVRVATSDTFTMILPATTGCVTGNISNQPAPINACKGDNATVSLTASGTDLVYQWQISSDGGQNFENIVGETSTSLSLTNLTESQSGTVYRCEINGACTDKLFSNSALLTVNALPNPPEVFGASRCGTGTVVLSATLVANETINWYAASSGGTTIGNGNSFITPSISTTTTYYASSTNSITGCISAGRTPAIATVLDAPAAPSGTGASACASGSLSLSASTVAGNTINWYSAPTGGTLLAQNSNTYTTPLLTTTTIYYAESNNGTCASTSRTAITATINALPVAISTVTNATKCGPDTTTLFATATTGNTVDWYADSLGTSLLQSGTVTGSNRFITPVLSSTTNYWVYHRNLTTGCRSAASRRVIATMNPKPAAPAANGAARCGTGTLTLTATAPSGGTVAWFNVSSGGTSLSTATSYTTPSISASTNYFVQSRITATGCVSATRTTVTATINAVPAAPVAGPNARCGTGSITVSATPGSGQTIDWYSASTGGTLLQSFSLTLTRTISTTTSYYATAKNSTTGCISASRTRVIATVSTRAPNTPTSLTGLTAICPIVGTPTGTTYTSSSVSGALSYVWTIPSGAVIDSGLNGLKIKVRFLRAGANDTIQVQASNGCLSAKRSLRLTTTGCVTTPIAKSTGNGNWNSNEIAVYPNPTTSDFQISLNGITADLISIKLMNAQGSILKTFNNKGGNNIRLGHDLKPGVYHLEIFTNGNRITKTIVKM